MNKEALITFVKDFINGVKSLWNDLIKDIKKLFPNKSRPKKVTSVHDYLEKKKKSEPFYKAVNGQRKPWE